jgi:A/G-specific adenine glycosylase
VKKETATPARQIAHALEAWFGQNGRDYPWRRTTDPYAIIVSELMLQQTQISTVLDRGYYHRWMEKFPDLATLAAASEAEVLRTWEGLGYYRRARFLQQMARKILADHAGVFPSDFKTVRALPGVGAYTAGAVCSFAHDARIPIVDGNVARVLARLWNDATPVDTPAGQGRLWERATLLVEEAKSPRAFNSALMELGQTICRVSSPACATCPVQKLCLATDPATLPVKVKKATVTEVTERVYFHQRTTGVLLQQETGSRRTGLWKLPELPQEASPPPLLHRARYTITRYKVTLWVHAAPPGPPAENLQWIPWADLPALPMPSPYRKALNALLAQANFQLSA